MFGSRRRQAAVWYCVSSQLSCAGATGQMAGAAQATGPEHP